MPRHRDRSSERSHTVRVSVRADELAAYRRLAYDHGISVSTLLWKHLNSVRVTSVTDARVAQELGHIGNNINQIARRLNMGSSSGVTHEELKPLLDIIAMLRLMLLGGRP